MTEREKLEYTKMFVDKLANGINPLDDTPIPDGDIMNNVRLSRCMFYVSDILRQVIEGDPPRQKKGKRAQRLPFALTSEQAAAYQFENSSVSLSEVCGRINDLIDTQTMKKLTYRSVASWLLKVGMLAEETNSFGTVRKRPTADGISIGIIEEITPNGRGGQYRLVTYSREAQQFIIDNIDAIAAEARNR